MKINLNMFENIIKNLNISVNYLNNNNSENNNEKNYYYGNIYVNGSFYFIRCIKDNEKFNIRSKLF